MIKMTGTPAKKLKVSDEGGPLLINSVLECLFACLTVDDLKKCRYVCTVWKTEAFRAIRKRDYVFVNLNTDIKQKTFLVSDIAPNFKLFSFNVCTWNEKALQYFSLTEVNNLSVVLNLTESNDKTNFQSLEYLLVAFANSLVGLTVRVDYNKTTVKHGIPERLLHLKFSKMKRLTVICKHNDVSWLRELWITMFKSSPVLKVLEFRNFNDDILWSDISNSSNFQKLTDLEYVHSSYTLTLGLHQQLIQTNLPVDSLKRLCISFRDSDSSLIHDILNKVAAKLEVLEFYTQDETPLSPIDFPVMLRLKCLDAGRSQFSFPTIVTEKFPQLSEIKATYWDWVYGREDLPDVHYYWRPSNQHLGITNIHLRFPDWTKLDFNYRRLENFNEFADVLQSKFPAACNFTFYNVTLSNDVRQALDNFVNVFEFSIKTFSISSYCKSKIHDASPCELTASDELLCQRELEIFDLCPQEWPEVWSLQRPLLSTIRDEWLASLLPFGKLRILKLLWAKDLLSRLNLANPNVLPNLVHLEFVGNLCVNRFDRALLRKSRPQLNVVQHKRCLCDSEDWWYMNESDSGKIFKRLFSYQVTGSVTSFYKRILFDLLT